MNNENLKNLRLKDLETMIKSHHFWRYLVASTLVVFCMDSLLQHRDYFGFVEFRPLFLLITFPLLFLSIKNHNDSVKTDEEKNKDIKRWEIRNLGRYEFIIILLIIFLFVPLTFFGQYTAFVHIFKASLITFAIQCLLKKSNNKVNQK